MAEVDQFELARRRAKQRTTAESQQQREALKRRFASMGGLGTGASIKAEQQVEQQGAERLQGAMEGIDVAQAQEQQRQREIEQARQFQAAEREAAQKFASQEAALGREFASKEALLGREFAKSERVGAQEFADAQRSASEAWQGAQNDEQRRIVQDQFKRTMAFEGKKLAASQQQWAQQMQLAWKQYGLDEKVTNANLEMQKWSKEGQMAGLRKGFASIFGGRSGSYSGTAGQGGGTGTPTVGSTTGTAPGFWGGFGGF